MTELKPCPFCGGNAYLANFSNRVCCSMCGVFVDEKCDKDAIAAWNRRAIDRDELLKVADSLDDGWAQFHDDILTCEDVDAYEQEKAEQIRKAVGA